jgi:hypothetical protein
MKMLVINCRELDSDGPAAKAVSAGSLVLIADMAYLRDERVERVGATDMEQEKRSKRANLSCIPQSRNERHNLASFNRTLQAKIA